MNLLKVSFAIQNVSDGVNSIGTASFPVQTTVTSLVANNPQYWLETDTNGNTHLCTVKTDETALQGMFITSAASYSLKAENFDVVDFFGGHPVQRPHAY